MPAYSRSIPLLHGTYGWQCSKEEQLYLIMHIHRVCVERAED